MVGLHLTGSRTEPAIERAFYRLHPTGVQKYSRHLAFYPWIKYCLFIQ
nr:MAG TPA: hypothetical protein [Caudoviricetes sp.]